MGRTNPTFRDLLRGLEARWQPYRRALRPADRERFDRLFDHARDHADAASHLDHDAPAVPLFLSVVLAQQRRIDTLEARLDAGAGDTTVADDTPVADAPQTPDDEATTPDGVTPPDGVTTPDREATPPGANGTGGE